MWRPCGESSLSIRPCRGLRGGDGSRTESGGLVCAAHDLRIDSECVCTWSSSDSPGLEYDHVPMLLIAVVAMLMLFRFKLGMMKTSAAVPPSA